MYVHLYPIRALWPYEPYGPMGMGPKVSRAGGRAVGWSGGRSGARSGWRAAGPGKNDISHLQEVNKHTFVAWHRSQIKFPHQSSNLYISQRPRTGSWKWVQMHVPSACYKLDMLLLYYIINTPDQDPENERNQCSKCATS